MRIGYGEDSHRLEEGRALWLGGVAVPSSRGAVAHSDGDVLLHALSDALLSSLALGDIGALFPDNDPQWKGLASRMAFAVSSLTDSRVILDQVLRRVGQAGYRLVQLSAVVMLDQPKLGPHRATIQQHLAQLCTLPPDRVGLTFKTSEQLAPQHAQCRVTVLLLPLEARGS